MENIQKKSLSSIKYSDARDEELRENIRRWLSSMGPDIHLPFFADTFADILVENRNRLHPLSYNTVNQLGSLMYHLKRISAFCEYKYFDPTVIFSEADNTTMCIVETKDFMNDRVHTVIMLNNAYKEAFEGFLRGEGVSSSLWNIMDFMDSPLVKYNVIDNTYLHRNISEYVSRFSSASWFENVRAQTVLVAGIGGIGSWVSMLLSRMQPANIIMYDDDTVEAVNMSGQLYSKQNIGMPKVTAMADTMYSFSNYNAAVEKNEKFMIHSKPCDIMISGFDNMGSRKIFYNVWKKHVMSKPEEERYKCLLIDGRLAAETLQVYCITGDDDTAMDKYEKEALFSDMEADDTVCSYKQTSYMANMIGGIIVNLFTNFCANYAAEAPIRTLPYYIEYEGALTNFKTVSL